MAGFHGVLLWLVVNSFYYTSSEHHLRVHHHTAQMKCKYALKIIELFFVPGSPGKLSPDSLNSRNELRQKESAWRPTDTQFRQKLNSVTNSIRIFNSVIELKDVTAV